MAVNPTEIIQFVFMFVWGKSIDRDTGIFLGSDVIMASL